MPVPLAGNTGLPIIPPPGAYAAQADLKGVVDPIPANADQLLVRASRAIDRALLTAIYDPTDPHVILALRQATVEQLLGGLQDGDRTGLGGTSTPPSFTLGRLSVQGAGGTASVVTRTGGLVDQAWAILQAAGLTGHAPQERW